MKSKFRQSISIFLFVIIFLTSQALAESLTNQSTLSDIPPDTNIWPEESKKLTSVEPSEINKLTNSQLIIGSLERGSETVKIIVNLKEPKQLKTVFGSNSEFSLEERQYEVAAIQAPVLSSLNSQDFQVRYVFENQAAFSVEVNIDGLAQLLNDPRVDTIEPVYNMERLTNQGISLMKATIPRQNYNGHGVAIAIIDDGFDYTHTKLGGGSFPNNKVIGGYDFGDNDSNPFPDNGDLNFHGTPCAGIAAGNSGEVGDYIGGVASGAKIYALKIADEDGNMSCDIIEEALEWCISHKNDDPQNPILVVSISLGCGKYYDRTSCDLEKPSFANTISDALSAGITVVAGSGNDGYCNAMRYPSSLSGVIAVGAVYDDDIGRNPAEGYVGKISSDSCAGYICTENPEGKCYVDYVTTADLVPTYSNSSSFLDIFAPANKAYTLDVRGPEGLTTDDYNPSFGGTSAACPYAAGAIACLQSASKARLGRYLSPSEVRDILISSGDQVTDTKPTPDITKPRINLERAIDSLVVHNEPPITGDCQTVSIGTGTKRWECPLSTYFHDCRTQVIYLASEIKNSGVITSLALDVTTIPSQILDNWTIRMKHTDRSSYESINDYYLDGSGWTIVYQNDEYIDNTGWNNFEFQRTFCYNGSDNLLVDFSFNNDFYTENGLCNASIPGPARSLIQFSDSEDGDPLNWSGAEFESLYYSGYIPNIRLTFCDNTTSISYKVTASDGNVADYFGNSVSINGNYMVVGAYEDDDKGLGSGSAYIFEHQGNNWIQKDKFVAPDGSMFNQFGQSVSISGDYTIIGAPLMQTEIGSAYIFSREGSNWSYQKKLTTWDWDKGEGDKFGSSVAIDGDYAVVGAIGDDLGCGAAYVFMRSGNNWVQQAKLIAEDWAFDDEFGCAVSISGNYVIVGAYGDNFQSGAAYVFERQGRDWTQCAKLIASDASIDDYLGYSVAISGDYVILGAYLDDDQIHDRGSAYIFRRYGDDWIEEARLIASDGAEDDHFGKSVSISQNTAIIGAPDDYITDNNKGSVYIFKRENNSWTQQAKLVASDGESEDNFGNILSINGSYAVIGVSGDDDKGSNSGSVYIYNID